MTLALHGKTRKRQGWLIAIAVATLALATVAGTTLRPSETARATETTVFVINLQPSWTAPGGGGVFSAYVGPPAYGYVSPGTTALYAGRAAGIIKAGFNTAPADDEGLFAFKPTVTINDFAAGPVTYVVANEEGINPVWMTIEVDTGTVDVDGVRVGNTAYQFVPASNPPGWNTFDAGAGQWLQWTTTGSGITTGSPVTLSAIASANTGRNVVRTYLRLGMGDSYYNGGTGTIAWVDKATLGGVTYDFAIKDQCKNGGWQTFSNPVFASQGACVSYMNTGK